MKRVLIDSSFLYALTTRKDRYHEAALRFARTQKVVGIVPDVVLTEVTYLIATRIDYQAMAMFLEKLETQINILEPITFADIKRVYQIMDSHQTSRLDFVDCCIMALSERLNITQVCTFDRRDFPIFVPNHADALELLP